MKLLEIEQPDYIRDGMWIFVKGYAGGFGAEMCVHLTREEVTTRCENAYGEGKLLIKNGTWFWAISD